jgi:hypothetical protein
MNIFSKIIKTTTDLLRGRTGSVKEIADFLGSQNYASAEINNYTCEEISKVLSQIDVAANSFSYLPTEFQADILVHNELPYGPSYKPQDTIDHVVYLRTQQAQQLLLILKKQERTDISRINMIKQKIKQAKASMV